jgi:acyl-CoA reductase-like NAD-dependent aldehyde dehydrogenase
MIESDLQAGGVTHATERFGPRLVETERCAYLRPTIAHCASSDCEIAKKEFMFPFATVVQCPESDMLAKIGTTLVGTVITRNPELIRAATDATHIDRLNVGPTPTTRLNWLQPHEGNLIDFLFRSRAYQDGWTGT